jgi:hypothetical protein
MATFINKPKPIVKTQSVTVPALALGAGTVKNIPVEDWSTDLQPVLVDFGSGKVIFIKPELIV